MVQRLLSTVLTDRLLKGPLTKPLKTHRTECCIGSTLLILVRVLSLISDPTIRPVLCRVIFTKAFTKCRWATGRIRFTTLKLQKTSDLLRSIVTPLGRGLVRKKLLLRSRRRQVRVFNRVKCPWLSFVVLSVLQRSTPTLGTHLSASICDEAQC